MSRGSSPVPPPPARDGEVAYTPPFQFRIGAVTGQDTWPAAARQTMNWSGEASHLPRPVVDLRNRQGRHRLLLIVSRLGPVVERADHGRDADRAAERVTE